MTVKIHIKSRETFQKFLINGKHKGLTVLNTKGNYFEVPFMVSHLKNTPLVSVVFEWLILNECISF